MRTVWVNDTDVDGRVEAGRVVTATHALDDWCLRGDDGSEPIPAGTVLEIVETRPWGASMALELAELHVEADVATLRGEIMQAARELEAAGLFEIVTDTGPELTPDGDVVTVERAVRAVRQ